MSERTNWPTYALRTHPEVTASTSQAVVCPVSNLHTYLLCVLEEISTGGSLGFLLRATTPGSR